MINFMSLADMISCGLFILYITHYYYIREGEGRKGEREGGRERVGERRKGEQRERKRKAYRCMVNYSISVENPISNYTKWVRQRQQEYPGILSVHRREQSPLSLFSQYPIYFRNLIPLPYMQITIPRLSEIQRTHRYTHIHTIVNTIYLPK